MSLKVAVQMDPIDRIRIAGDSTFALLLEAQSREHQLYYYTPDRLSLDGERLVAPLQTLRVHDVQDEHAKLGEAIRTDLSEMDVVLLRQDPPFDLAYVTTTHLLERIHPRTLVVNNPQSVRDAPEKLFVLNFPELMPTTLISRDRFSVTFKEPWVIQKFLPAVSAGDKRIILVDGVALGAVNRVPVGDDIRSNMVRGGSAKETELTPREKEICARIGPELKRRGLIFVGIDVIDGHLTEINVTSPTGLRAIQRLGGPNLAAAIWDSIEAKRRGENVSPAN